MILRKGGFYRVYGRSVLNRCGPRRNHMLCRQSFNPLLALPQAAGDSSSTPIPWDDLWVRALTGFPDNMILLVSPPIYSILYNNHSLMSPYATTCTVMEVRWFKNAFDIDTMHVNDEVAICKKIG